MTLFSFQKLLGNLMMPAGLVWLLLIAVCGVYLRRRQWGTALLLTLATLGYTAAGNFYLGATLMAGLERQLPPVNLDTVAPFDAVCVLGGGCDEDPWGDPQLSSAGDRVFLAARLWHQGKARLLVTSGMNLDGVKGLEDSGEQTRALWRQVGVPDSAILVVKEPCWITRDEIGAYRRLHDRFGWKRMALLSTASHLPRALVQAERAGLAMTPLGADWQGRSHPFEAQYLVPQGTGFRLVQLACWEILGRWAGR
jgi:uncharacterized SAM-binding protein YcdF (DUF218 family)